MRPAGISRDSTSTVVPCSSSFRWACSSRSGAARRVIASSHFDPFFDRTPRCPSQYRQMSPRNAAPAATAKVTSRVNGDIRWNATTAAELTSAPVGTTGTSEPRATRTNNDG